MKANDRRLNKAIGRAVRNAKPPENLTVDQWADRYRVLSPENAAETGRWRTSRTPYLREIMKAFTDPGVRHIVLVSASQIGKSELELNIIGYIIDQDPGSVLFVQPTLDDARKFSRLRVAPMIRDSEVLRSKVRDVKSRDSGNTILQKSFSGGMLTITGSNSPSALASTPARYVLGDERDRWTASAGAEGDPWGLAEARQATFYNAKSVEVSTPTIKGHSNIETAYNQGTQERWCHRCPDCGEYSEITFKRIRFEYEMTETGKGKKTYRLKGHPVFVCPKCGCANSEAKMRKSEARWVAGNPDAAATGTRSFWLTAFASPWTSWDKIILKFLNAKGDPERLKVVYNTLLGELWEERGDLASEDEMLARREEYGAELPDSVLCLTMGVDTQDDRLEYEVVGHGMFGETWGIQKGIINGDPSMKDRPGYQSVWTRLDGVIQRKWEYADGRTLKISATFVDSGGHKTQDVYRECSIRRFYQVYAIRGKPGENTPYTSVAVQAKIVQEDALGRRKVIGLTPRFDLGVDAGKTHIMSALKVQEPGAKYCHFPSDDGRGYGREFFTGLLSEKQVYANGKWKWEKLPGHERNEALDCRNYAMAAFVALDPNMDRLERERHSVKAERKPVQKKKQQKRRALGGGDDW